MSDIIEFIFLLTTILGILIYTYLVWNFGYWKKRGVTGPKPKLLFGNIPNAIKESRNIIYDYDDIYKTYRGKEQYVGFYMIRNPQLLLIDPDVIRKVFVTNFKNFNKNEFARFTDVNTDRLFARNPFLLTGNDWKEKRNEITPALTGNRIKAMYPVMLDVCRKLTEYLEKETCTPPEDGLEAKVLAGKYTTEVVSNCIYGIEAGAFSSNNCVIFEMGTKIMDMSLATKIYFMAISIFPNLRKIYSHPFIPKSIENFFIELMREAKTARLKNKTDRADFLNYLIQLDEKKNLSYLDMAAHTLTFFLDGFETSSILISHCLHMLARHEDVQNRLRSEIEEATAKTGEIEFEKLNELPYLDQCINETLRMFPPAMILGKICTEPCEFINAKGGKIQFEDGNVVEIPIYCLHHDEEYYPNPEEFNPDRFSPDNGGVKKYKDMGVFLPFGDGPRTCLGMKFGLAQSKAGVVEIVRNWKISVNKKTRNDYLIGPTQFLAVLDGGIWLNYKRLKQ